MKFLMFMFLAGCAVKCDDGGNYYVIEIPKEDPTTTTTTSTTTTPKVTTFPTTSTPKESTTTFPSTTPLLTTYPTTDYQKYDYNRLHVYWNVPTTQCRSKKIPFENLRQFGIIQNENDNFRGDKIVIFYDPGLFPAIFQNQTSGKLRYRNGGVPQEGDLKVHLESFRSVVNQTIPDPNFRGIAIIDFESWRPIFRQNWADIELYKEVSYKIEKTKHWFWPEKWIHLEAKERFEKAARIFMQNTISLAKQMRPHAVWGYYGFPYCFNMAGEHMTESCAKGVDGENDQIYWLWLESTGLYPSVYSSHSLSSYQLGKMIKGRIHEAARVRHPGTPILPYFWFRYREGGFLREIDLHTALQTFNQSEASGFIIWGSSNDVNTVEKCQNLHDYVYKIFGPAIDKYAKHSRRQEDETDTITDWLENNTAAENLDITSTEMISSTTDSTSYFTDVEIDSTTTSTEVTLSDISEEDDIVATKSLINILMGQIFNGDSVEHNETNEETKNTNSQNVFQSTMCNLSKTNIESKISTLTDISPETSTEKLQKITSDDWTTIISDMNAKSGPFEENLTPIDDSGYSTDIKSSTETTSYYLPTESLPYLENNNINRKKDAITENTRTEIETERLLLSTSNDLSSIATKDSTYSESHVEEDLNYSTNTENPTISTNIGGFEKSTTESLIQSTTDNLPAQTSTYIEIIKDNLRNKSTEEKPKNRIAFTTTDNTMTEMYTESTINDSASTVTLGSTYLVSSVEENPNEDTKTEKAKHRINDIENNSAGDTNYIFFNQNTFNQNYSDNSKLKQQNEKDNQSYKKMHLLKERKKGLRKYEFSKTEDKTSTPITTLQNELEHTDETTEDIVQDDNSNKEKSTNIHTPVFAVTSSPASLTSGTSAQVVVRII